jgi:3-hydroxyacyl-[acyl-carrier-protein] dehydratase
MDFLGSSPFNPQLSMPAGESILSPFSVLSPAQDVVSLAFGTMHFMLIDRITEIRPGASITAIKALSLAEEYLQDHFPRFPVMPGVLMLEAMLQAGTFLVHRTEDFQHSTVVLRKARNLKFAGFVRPGETLTVRVEIIENEGNQTTVKGEGWIGETLAVSGRLVLERYNAGDRQPHLRPWDAHARAQLRQRFEQLYRPQSEN